VELLDIVFVNGLPDCKVVLSPVVFILSAAIQVYGDAKLLVNGMFTVPPVQIVAVFGFVMAAAGFTVTVKVCEIPRHPCGVDVGVIV
jgi:hypothetical protein